MTDTEKCPRCGRLMSSCAGGWVCECGCMVELVHSDKKYCFGCDTELPEGDMVCGKCKKGVGG